MPFTQKIKSTFVDDNGNRKHFLKRHRVPQAPPAPAAPLSASTFTSEPLTTQSLTQQKDLLQPVEPVTAVERETLMVEPAVVLPANDVSVSILSKEPVAFERIEKAVVIQERFHPMEKEEIQPIIYREREQLDVRQITQMLHETEIRPTILEQRELAAETRAPIVERATPIAENIVLASTVTDDVQRSTVIHAPIVEELIKKTVIEEIQPVLERDIFAPTVIRNTQPIYEKIVEAPVLYREVMQVRELGTRHMSNSVLMMEKEVATSPSLLGKAAASRAL
ncbi:hypothetical protein PROFUN_05510 [Planoprotostelium fungivorum]|uniref:Uncharacterized protein n=1 Tax=Planoprotostelium fungivorum TaxID=1890364 RepID=A0A2P6NQY0_9EUKA|nr:hypothetical protein PROFUN_05510 [Planoprotostelium fungivorum]